MATPLQVAVEAAWVSRDFLDQLLHKLPYNEYKKVVCGITVRFLTADMEYKVGRVHSVAPSQADGTLIVDAGAGPTEVVLPKNVSNSLFKQNEIDDWLNSPLAKQDGLIQKLEMVRQQNQMLKDTVKGEKKGRAGSATREHTPPAGWKGAPGAMQAQPPVLADAVMSSPTDGHSLFPHALMISADGTPTGHVPVSEIVNKAVANNNSEPWDMNGLSASASFSPLGVGASGLGVFSVEAEGSTTADIVMKLEQDTKGVCGAERWIRDLMDTCIKSWSKGIKSTPRDFATRIMHLCSDVTKVLLQEPMLLRISSPLCVFGDLHGNFADLHYFLQKLLIFGEISYTGTTFLFLGDYVDRGVFGLESVVYLLCLKMLSPKQVLLLRGNHESPEVNGDIKQYGDVSFKYELQQKFPGRVGEQVWEAINKVFQCLPAAAIVDGKIFCAHGGIPRFTGGTDDRLETLEDPKFPRFVSIQVAPALASQESAWTQKCRKIMEDLVWSDPADQRRYLDEHGFGDNPRGVGLKTFGSKAVDEFLDKHGLTHIFRAHQEKSNGVRICDNARVLTIFSTSDYIGHQNGAGVAFVTHGHIRLAIKEAG